MESFEDVERLWPCYQRLANKILEDAIARGEREFVSSKLFELWVTTAFGVDIDLDSARENWVKECARVVAARARERERRERKDKKGEK